MISTLLLAILNSFWLVAAVAVSAVLAMRIVPRFSAATRYAIWWTVLGATLVLPAVRSMPSITSGSRDAAVTPAGDASRTTAVADVDTAAVAAEPDSAADLRASASHPAFFPLHLPAGRWPLWVLAVWTVVFLFHLARIAWSYRYLRGVTRRARKPSAEQRLNFDQWVLTCHVRRPVRLLLSDEIASPMAVGFRHPAVLVPGPLMAELSEAELDHALLHEIAHIARYDDWTNLIARVAAAGLVLHPIAAWVLRRIAREREIACDDWVVGVTGAARPYAECLARLLEVCSTRRHELLATGLASPTTLAGERIERLIHYAGVAPRASARRVALTLAMAAGFVAAGAYASSWVALADKSADKPADAPVAAPAPAPAPAAAFSRAVAPQPLSPPSPLARVTPAPFPVPAEAPAPAPQPERPGFLAALRAAGYTNLSVDEIIELKIHGVSADYITAMNRAGFGHLTQRQLVDSRIHGVTPEDVQRAKKFAPNIKFEQVLRLKMAAVI